MRGFSHLWRFRLRTLLGVLTVIAVVLGWMMERVHRRRAAMDVIERAGARLDSEFEFRTWWAKAQGLGIPGFQPQPVVRSWSERVWGHSQRSVQFVDRRVTPAAVQATAVLGELRFFHARDTNLNDDDLAALRGLTRLEHLDLTGCPITDRSANVFGGFQELQCLELDDTQIGDETAAELAKLKKLEVLRIRGTRITDRGVAHLCALSNLRELSFGDSDKNPTLITTVGRAEIERRLTNRAIYKSLLELEPEIPQPETPP